MEISDTVQYAGLAVALLSSVTYCVVKVTAQMEQSRCSEIHSPCCSMTRNLDIEAALVDIERPVAGAGVGTSRTATCCVPVRAH